VVAVRGTARRILLGSILLAVLLAFSAAGAEPAVASDCTICHTAGGIAPDGSSHPVPPPPLWDPTDGVCTICHEIENSPFYQLPPHGAYPIDGYAADEDDYAYPHGEIWLYDIPCSGCHNGTQLVHGRPFNAAWASAGPINIAGSDCAGCHTSGMAYPTDAVAPAYTAQIDPATHGDTTLAHAGIYESGCASCHPGDVEDIHTDCMTCHATSPPDGATCSTCHDDLGPNHGDPTAAHANIANVECARCHGANVTLIHTSCATCHPPYSGPGITGETCMSCHDDLPEGHGVIAGSRWSYQDLSDASPKYEGGYECFTCHRDTGLVVVNPHGGYDTSTNKCKVCHAVHRAEGTYYLLRASSQDDACDFCHIGHTAHSDLVVYTGNDAGKYTPNGHTMGASSRIPDSTTYMETVTVTLQGTPVKVRTYDETKKQLYRTQWWGRSPLGHPTIGSMSAPTYGKTGPTRLNCSSCHQVHNATSQIWRPAEYLDGYNNPAATRDDTGYKLLRRFPGATTLTGPGELTGTTAIAKVPESTLIADVNYSTNASMETTYVDIDAAGNGDGLTWRQPDWVVGSQFSGYVANVTQFTLSVWCADCHNLNIGARGVVTGDSELGFGRAHAERTHPVPASRGFQCYSCHRSGLGAASGCNRCHYNNENYAAEAPLEVTNFGRPTDFPHAGADDECKLLGAFSIDSPPPATFPNTWDVVYAETAIGPDNLDAVCIRCHTDQGVHQ